MTKFGSYSMNARPTNAPHKKTEIPGPKLKVGSKVADIDLGAILEKSASSFPIYTPLALTTIAQSAQGVVGALANPYPDYSNYGDEEIFKKYFKEFSEKEFVDFLNILLSEMKSMEDGGVPKDIMIHHLVSEIGKFLTGIREKVLGNMSISEGKKQILVLLIGEFQKRLVNSLRNKLDSI